MAVNIPSQIKRQTAAEWAADAAVYSNMLLVTSDVNYDSTTFPQFKIANGTDPWSVLDYAPFDEVFFRLNNIDSDLSNLANRTIADVLNVGNTLADNQYLQNPSGQKIIQLGGSSLDVDGVYIVSDDKIDFLAPSVKKNGVEIATETFVNNQISSAVVGLLDDRGNFDASVNLFPSSGGSGTAGAILKGDLWTISVAGTLNGIAVTVGDVVRSLSDTPGQTASNWVVTENNIGYVAENSSNKSTSVVTDFSSNTKYPSVKSVYDWVISLGYLTASLASSTYQTIITAASWGIFINGLTSKSTPVDADYVGLMDSAASNVSKKLSWANIKATLKTYFDTLYEPVITKLSAFNKNFGTASGTVTEGNDYRLNLLHVVDTGSLSVSSPADSATVYVGISTPLVPVGTAANRQFKLPTGVLRMVNMYVDPTGTLGTNENVTVNLRNITDSTSSTIGTITYDAKGNSTFVTGLSITTSSAKLYAIEYVYPAFSTNPTNVYTVNQLFIYAS